MRWSLREKLPRAVRVTLAFGIFVSLTIGSLIPRLALSPDHGIDLAVHGAVYAIVTVLTVLLFVRPLMSATYIFALSCTIEIMQAFMPGRIGSWVDVAANGFGIAMAFGVVRLLGAREFPVVAVKTISK